MPPNTRNVCPLPRGLEKGIICSGSAFSGQYRIIKCRCGERGVAAAKPKAQIIPDAAKVSAASGGKQRTEAGAAVAECEALPPKHDTGTATRHYRAFWQRRCRAAAAGAVLAARRELCGAAQHITKRPTGTKQSHALCRWADDISLSRLLAGIICLSGRAALVSAACCSAFAAVWAAVIRPPTSPEGFSDRHQPALLYIPAAHSRCLLRHLSAPGRVPSIFPPFFPL